MKYICPWCDYELERGWDFGLSFPFIRKTFECHNTIAHCHMTWCDGYNSVKDEYNVWYYNESREKCDIRMRNTIHGVPRLWGDEN